jgi:DNA-binding PadR family transcriptional regulator
VWTSTRRKALSTTEYAVLGLLGARDDQSGYDLLKRLDRAVGYMWAPAKSGLYAVLGRLEEDGLATVRRVRERGPSKELYRLTGAGRDALAAWVSDPTLELRPPRDPFLLKLHFARRASPAAAASLVRAYRARVAALLAEWEEQEREGADEPVDLITLRFALARARATLGWCDETLETLEAASG